MLVVGRETEGLEAPYLALFGGWVKGEPNDRVNSANDPDGEKQLDVRPWITHTAQTNCKRLVSPHGRDRSELPSFLGPS